MKNKIMKKDLDEMHGHEESWKLWMKEAEQRERQQAGKEMPRCSGKESGKECFATDTCKPSPSAPSEYVEAKSEMMALRHKHDDESYAFRPPPKTASLPGIWWAPVCVYHSVQSSCIGWKDRRLREIRRRAKHAEERQTEERDKELEKHNLTAVGRGLETSNQTACRQSIMNIGRGKDQSVYHSVQSSCIGWKDRRLREIRRRAKHAEERQTEERDKELEKHELTQYNASLTMMQSIVDQHAGRGPNRGRRGRGRGRGGKQGRGGGRGQTQENNATLIARDPEKVTGHLRLIKFVSPPPQFFRDGRTLSVDLEAVTSRSNKFRLTENILNSGVYHSVQSSCIGWKDQRLREIRRRAKHAEERQTEERDKELEKQISATNLALSAGSQADRSGPGEGDWPSETDQICLTSTSVLSRREDPLRGPRSCHLEVQQIQINRKHPKFRELIQIRLRGGLVTSQKGEQYGRNTAHSVTSRGIHSGEPRHHLTSLTVSDTRKKRTQETTQ
ncbi:hypothetical protein GBF38_000053, partial [Nibea albiflora]